MATLQDRLLTKPSLLLPDWISRMQLVHYNSVLVRSLGLKLQYMPLIHLFNKRRQRPFCWWMPKVHLNSFFISAEHNICQLCPSLATALNNSYRTRTGLFVDGAVIFSCDGTTQGGQPTCCTHEYTCYMHNSPD